MADFPPVNPLLGDFQVTLLSFLVGIEVTFLDYIKGG